MHTSHRYVEKCVPEDLGGFALIAGQHVGPLRPLKGGAQEPTLPLPLSLEDLEGP